MEQKLLEIKENTAIAKNIYRLVLEGDIEKHLPGQFINIKVPGMYLRRPLSVCDYDPDRLTVCYKTAGEGTKILSTLKAGSRLDVLTGLGNGYDLSTAGSAPVLIGGGMGCAPLYFLAKEMIKNHTSLEAVLGFNTENEVFYAQNFINLGCGLHITTADGSCGIKGFATDAIPEKYSCFYSCGPLPMMKAVDKKASSPGQFSLEERLGCGFGACMGCSVKVRAQDRTLSENAASGSSTEAPVIYKRICKDGPVFKREEIIWED